MKRMTQQQLWATAYHEAGHAVAALAYGKGIRRQGATIVRNAEGAAGSVYMLKHIPGDPSVDSLTGRMRLRIEEDVIVLLAGGIAQREFRASSLRSYHGRSDHEAAIDLLMYIVGDEDLWSEDLWSEDLWSKICGRTKICGQTGLELCWKW